MFLTRLTVVVGVLALALAAGNAQSEDIYLITLKNHQFTPQVLTIPTDKKVKLIIKNDDVTPAEFESNALNREKIVGGKATITVFVGPLKAGTYVYFDDFHKATTTAKLEAK